MLLGESVGSLPAPAPAPAPAPEPETDALAGPADAEDEIEVPEHVLQLHALFTELEPVEPEQIVLALAGSAASRLAGRAAFLGLMKPSVASDLTLERDWQALLRSSLSGPQLALLVRSEPWLPPTHGGEPFCGWLVSQAVITAQQLEALHNSSIEQGWPIFQVALEQGILDEQRYVGQLARFAGLELAAAPRGIARSSVVGFPLGWVEHFELVPLEREGGAWVIGVATPLPDELLYRLQADTGGVVECRLAAPAVIAAWRRRWLRHWWRLHFPGRTGLSGD